MPGFLFQTAFPGFLLLAAVFPNGSLLEFMDFWGKPFWEPRSSC